VGGLMFILNKENVVDYIKSKTNLIDIDQIPVVTEVGDGEASDDGDGFVNFLFRVKTQNKSIIVKQARSYLKAIDGYSIPVSRNKLEYETLKLRNSIVPQYIPNIYFVTCNADPYNTMGSALQNLPKGGPLDHPRGDP